MEKEEFYNSLSQEEKDKLIKLDKLLQDKDFRNNLKLYPKETLKTAGFEFPEEKKIFVIDADQKIPADKDEDTIYLRVKSGKHINTTNKFDASSHRGGMVLSFFKDLWKNIKS
jgi:hypothetical protein